MSEFEYDKTNGQEINETETSAGELNDNTSYHVMPKIAAAVADDRSETGSDDQTESESEKQTGPVDFYAPRAVTVQNVLRNKPVEFVHQTVRLDDKMWLDFYDELDPRTVVQGKKETYAANEEKAIRATYKKLVKEIPTGYQPFFKQTLTKENFSDLIPLADQESVINQAFAFAVSENDEEAFFFDAEDHVPLVIASPIGEEYCSGNHYFKPVTGKDKKDYAKADEIDPPANRGGFRKIEVSLKRDYEALATLFVKMTVSAAENYDESAGIPIWHKIGLMDYLFLKYARPNAKN